MRIGSDPRLDRIAAKLGPGYCPECHHCRPENTAELDREFHRLWAEMEAAAEERGRDQVRQGSTA